MLRTTRRFFLGGAAAFAATGGAGAADGRVVRADDDFTWERPDGTATDSVMARRIYLDLSGRIPTKAEAVAYFASDDGRKRERLVEERLSSREFVDYWTMRFCDVLRVKSEFPVNLWPNAVYAYHARIRSFVERDEPWDAFARALLTARGSNFRDAEVNFFRATSRRDPDGWAEATAQTFLGIPPDRLPPSLRSEIAAHFASLKIKDTREWKEEVVYSDGSDRRAELCDELFVRRRGEVEAAFHALVRSWVFGEGSGARGSGGGMRLRDVLRGVVMSDEYARGSVTGGFPARRLDAEVLDDVLCELSGTGRDYQSPAPEPFTFLPPDRPTVCIEDGSISSGFLTLFGRPARDTGLASERGLDVTAKQRLYMYNSAKLDRQLSRIVSGGRQVPGRKPYVSRMPFIQRVDDLYWRVLSRAPTQRERERVVALMRSREKGPRRKSRSWDTLRDLAWCLVNTGEFLFRI